MQLQNHTSLLYRTYSEDFLVIDVGFNEASLKYVRVRTVRNRRRSVFYTVNEHGNSGKYDEEEDEDEDKPAIR